MDNPFIGLDAEARDQAQGALKDACQTAESSDHPRIVKK